MDTLPVVLGRYPRQLSRSISKTKDDASQRTRLLPPPKGSGFPPNYVGGIFMNFGQLLREMKKQGWLLLHKQPSLSNY